jgi:hypothetical protein
MNRLLKSLTAGLAAVGAFALLASACTYGPTGYGSGSCVVDKSPTFMCGAAVAYTCTGGSRPDQNPTYVSGLPQGLICTDLGADQSGGTEDWCCSAYTTPCAYDPVAGCAAPAYGYECQGAGRPESYNQTISCGEGLDQGDTVIYCCSGSPPAQGCTQSSGGGCPATLVPWNCYDNTLPSEFELGSNQSRADFNLLICNVPTVTVTTSRTTSQYCCYTPTMVPAGASCVQDTTVPNCPRGAFGFACTGFDTPDQDYPRINCADAGAPVQGTNAQGYAASLYCCQFQ